jgi:hypothetical protein
MSLAIPVPIRSDNARGILAMLAAMGSLIVNDCFIKVAAAELPTGEVTAAESWRASRTRPIP